MAERRKIIISTGASPDEPLSTPHFDAEATMTARPVVPLTDQEPYQMPRGAYVGRTAKPFWKRPGLLVLLGLVAIGIGVAAGFAIGIYRNRSVAQSPVTTAPSSTVENANPRQTVEPPAPTPAPQERAAVPEKTEEPAVEPKDEERDRTVRNERKDDDNQVKPPVVRDKKRGEIDDDDNDVAEAREEEQAEREQRREERRERRRRQREEIRLPQVERAGRELDRIREIFEGKQP